MKKTLVVETLQKEFIVTDDGKEFMTSFKRNINRDIVHLEESDLPSIEVLKNKNEYFRAKVRKEKEDKREKFGKGSSEISESNDEN